MALPSHRRRPPRKRRAALVPGIAVLAAGLVVLLVVAFQPGHRADDAGHARATSLAGDRASAPSSPTRTRSETSQSRPESGSGSPSPSSSAATSTPAPHRTGAAPSRPPSATAAVPRTGSGAAPLAGRIRPAVTYRGVATHYDAGDGDGACLYGPTDDLMIAAMNHADYESAKACGAYVRVRTADGASVTVRVTNECPLPCAPGQLDLSVQAFAKLAAPSRGRIAITWSLLSPSTTDTISLRYKTGSSRYWCAVQVIGHRNPVARLEVRSGGGWSPLPRTDFNYFLSEHGSGCGGGLRITDIYGERLVVDGIALRPDAVQPTRVQFAAH
ncbi:expansin EXLX1 family cellulose-binding protein [Streptomyces sp. NPDC020490]|uniref:expansin EXLX1 family cellulose-binding protein n=1 Tax=Streptomyces sp. NPDC020490 TaxID=3365078 RepID=UPI0037BD46D0